MFDTLIHRWLSIPYVLNIRTLRRVKKPRSTLLFVHGIGDSGDMWRRVIDSLPGDVSIIVIDLLGFGDSPRPRWAKYDAKMQASSLLSTYLKLRIRTKVTVVGHSLGSLVAIEFAKRYPLLTESLILCSPPIYKRPENKGVFRNPDDILRQLYTRASDEPDRLIKLYALANKIGVGDENHVLDTENVKTFITTLRASIINQNTIDDIPKLKMPIHILHGLLDPFVVRSNLVRLAKDQPNITFHGIAAGHNIRGPYVKKVVKTIEAFL